MTLFTTSIAFNLATRLPLPSLPNKNGGPSSFCRLMVFGATSTCGIVMSQQSLARKGTHVVVERANINASVSTVHDKYVLFKEIQPGVGDRCSRQSLILLPLPCLSSLFPPSANMDQKRRVHTRVGIYTKCTGCHCSNPRPVLKHSHKTSNQTNPGTTQVLGNRRDPIQAAELWTFISIGVLCSPRAAPVLMRAASWTAVTQPRRLHIQSEAGQRPRLWEGK